MTTIVKRELSKPMAQQIQSGKHQLSADGTLEEGGSDSGPSPHDLYDAALGACKALTMIWFAKRKGIPLEDATVTIERDDSDERSGTYRLHAKVELVGNLTEEQRQQLLTVAGKCPVHKLMTAVTTEITTSLV
jgi:putative redox protein